MPEINIRPASPTDAEAIRAIYAPVVETTHISFELEPPSVEEMARRITTTTAQLPWLVGVRDGRVIGYAYAAPHNPRRAYQWAVETSIYLDAEVRGQGIGAVLYRELLGQLRSLGYVSAFAGIALPNEASIALHERVGYEPIGRFPVAGFKLGRWIDVGLWRCGLNDPPDDPKPPPRWG